jgi:hypothetical protein
VRRAHIADHQRCGAATQLALDRLESVRTLILLESSLLLVPSGEALFQPAGPAFDGDGRGDHEGALAIVLSIVSGLALRRRPPTFLRSSLPHGEDCTIDGRSLPAAANKRPPMRYIARRIAVKGQVPALGCSGVTAAEKHAMAAVLAT